MKNKGILFVLLLVVVIIAIVILSFAYLFSVRNIEIQRENAFSNLSEQDILKEVLSIKGKNIFFVNENQIKKKLSEKLPYAEVLDVERVFPSSIIIKVEERVSLFSLFIDSKYFIFNRNGVLLGIEDSNYMGEGQVAPTEIIGIGELKSADFLLGQTPDSLSSNDKFIVLKEFFDYLFLLEYRYTDFMIKSFISQVEISAENDLVIMTNYGNRLVIYNSKTNLKAKVQNIIAAYTSGMATDNERDIYIGDNLLPTLSSK